MTATTTATRTIAHIETRHLDRMESARFVIWATNAFDSLDLVPVGADTFDVTESISRKVVDRVKLTQF